MSEFSSAILKRISSGKQLTVGEQRVSVGVVQVLSSGQALDTAVAVAAGSISGSLDLGKVGNLVDYFQVSSHCQ